MNLQTQRLLGQQSLAEFMGLNVWMDQVFRDNDLRQGVQRKNKFIINTGDNLTAKEREEKIKINKKKYGLIPEEIRSLQMPKVRKSKRDTVLTLEQIFHPKSNFSIVEKLHHLTNLKNAATNKLLKIQKRRIEYGPCRQVIVCQKLPDEQYSLLDIKSQN